MYPAVLNKLNVTNIVIALLSPVFTLDIISVLFILLPFVSIICKFAIALVKAVTRVFYS